MFTIFTMSRREIIKAANRRISGKLSCSSISTALYRSGGEDVPSFLQEQLGSARPRLTAQQKAVFDALISGELKVSLTSKGSIGGLVVCLRVGHFGGDRCAF